ncbi:E3 SUMO-protein ligase ZBED1-like [Polypterus senegalus]|uniref:E3 SUMO-protein ligase ZBED1-like n=1 Tax=Polypterus senegalus TaxID=55291 RepID=UPI0019648FBD|nr:E3 SUMO-protein ligase ZBED1-like [Polypterus senegalus]
MEDSNIQSSEKDQEILENECPWPHLEELFMYRGRKGDSMLMQCKLCLPSVVISAYKTSASNLKKHIMRKHPSKIDQYHDIIATSASSQRKTTAIPNKLSASKQVKLPDVMLAPVNKRVPQATVDKLIINFICEGLQPFAVVEQPAFKELITTLQPHAKVISRSTVRTRICDAAEDIKTTIIAELGKAKFVATTTDCWSAHQKSYLGVTCHWIEEESLERRSAALACKRLRGSYTFDMIASALDDVHFQYKIRDKVVRTTTDSGSNFIKAFHVFGAQNDAEVDEDEADLDTLDVSDHIEYHDKNVILDEDSGMEYQLPPHQRCACHLLNLVATADTALAECMNDTYLQKAFSLSPAEVAFLREYCITMKPLVKASNILQSESSTYMGWLLPVIHQLLSKLNRLETSSKTCMPLIKALQNGLQKRFGQMMANPDLAAAAVLLPKFKTSWTDRADVIEAALTYLKQHLETTEHESEHQQRESSDDDDFFSRPLSRMMQSPIEPDGYLACASDSMELLHSFPAIKKLSLKLNTALPASAACERLFSCAGLLFTSKRSRIDSMNFENQLLLKLYKRFRK